MAQSPSNHVRQLHRQSSPYLRLHFSWFYPSEAWSPNINAFLCARELVVCVDLAGVERSALDLLIEPRRLRVRGQRKLPEPGTEEAPLQTLAMEIDYGPFERELALPVEVDTARVTAKHRKGLLWIHLPLLSEVSG